MSDTKQEVISLWRELQIECIPDFTQLRATCVRGTSWSVVRKWFHIPYTPALHQPGWLTRCLVGPYCESWRESIIADFAAELCLATGILMVSLSLLNVGNLIRFLSYPVMSGFTSAAAALIGLNQIKQIFGFTTSYFPQVGDGITANNYQAIQWILLNWDATNSPSAKVDLGEGPVSLTPKVQSELIREYTAKLGQGKSVINPFAISIFFGLWIPLMIVNTTKKRIKVTANRKKSWCFSIWILLANIAPAFAIVIGAVVAFNLKHSIGRFTFEQNPLTLKWEVVYNGISDGDRADLFYALQLRIIGNVPRGLEILRIPEIRNNFGEIIVAVVPLTLIAYMESYSVARKMASIRNELHILNSSQELWAIGLANLLGSVSSAYPVAGSFSRSSLNLVSGARTPLSKVTTLAVILVTLEFLTDSFYYVPQAALAAVILASISSLIDLRDYWNSWKYSKKDFCIMVWTSSITFCFDTKWGLVAGIGMSVFWYIVEIAFAPSTLPHRTHPA